MKNVSVTANITRQGLAGLLAKASLEELTAGWDALQVKPEIEVLRGPETGLVMTRGCIGGGGAPFNLGETTVTRTTVRLSMAEGETSVGHAYALGRDHGKIRLAAILDALWQLPQSRELVESHVIRPVVSRINAQDQQCRREVAATKVDFFTMVRGDD